MLSLPRTAMGLQRDRLLQQALLMLSFLLRLSDSDRQALRMGPLRDIHCALTWCWRFLPIDRRATRRELRMVLDVLTTVMEEDRPIAIVQCRLLRPHQCLGSMVFNMRAHFRDPMEARGLRLDLQEGLRSLEEHGFVLTQDERMRSAFILCAAVMEDVLAAVFVCLWPLKPFCAPHEKK